MELTFFRLSPLSDTGRSIIDKVGSEVILVGTSQDHPGMNGDALIFMGRGELCAVQKLDDLDIQIRQSTKVPEISVEFKFTLPTDDGGTLSIERMNLDVRPLVAPGRAKAVENGMRRAINVMGVSLDNPSAVAEAVKTSVDNWRNQR